MSYSLNWDAMINYQCAWSFDVLEKEREAISYYEIAIQLGLPDEQHAESMSILLKLLAETSDDQSIKQFSRAIEFYSDQLDKIFK